MIHLPCHPGHLAWGKMQGKAALAIKPRFIACIAASSRIWGQSFSRTLCR
jgi:hypothetical protein